MTLAHSLACTCRLRSRFCQCGLQAVAPALKLSSQQDWTREAAMHRECAQCPFVLQLLAAKRCRSSNLLLLLEYAAQGSLTDMLAARRLELEMQEYSAGGGLQPAAPQAAHTEADTVAAAAVGLHANPASTAEQLQQAAEAHRSSWSGTAAVMQVADDPQVRMVLPLAVTAAHILGEDADSMEDILPVSKMTTTGQLPPQRQEQPFKQHSGIVDEPVLVTLLEDATLSASQCMQEHTHAVLRSSDIVAAATAAAVASDGQLPAALSGLKPVGHGLPEETARFYAACILMALKTLHSRRILHRSAWTGSACKFCRGCGWARNIQAYVSDDASARVHCRKSHWCWGINVVAASYVNTHCGPCTLSCSSTSVGLAPDPSMLVAGTSSPVICCCSMTAI